MNHGIFLTMALCLTACTPGQNRVSSYETDQLVYDLLGKNAAAITMTRIKGRGIAELLLAKVLGVPNVAEKSLPQGVYKPIALERKLHNELKKTRNFVRLKHVLDPYSEKNLKANANFYLDFASERTNTVEYRPGYFRRSYFFEIGLSFKLLDENGRLVYEREFIYFRLHACIFTGTEKCKDIVTGQAIDTKSILLQLIHHAFENSITETVSNLQNWAITLRHLTAPVDLINHSDGKIFETKKDAAYIRNRRWSAFPFLFLETKPKNVLVNALIRDLNNRGAQLDRQEQSDLKHYITTVMRSSIDNTLRKELEESDMIEYAGIFQLPDSESIWFRDALSRTFTDSSNYEKKYDSKIYGRPCSGLDNRDHDRCFSVSALYKDSDTIKGAPLNGVQYTQQFALLHGILTDPKLKHLPNHEYLYPHSKSPNQRGVAEAGVSDQYLRVQQAKMEDNDDNFYLRQAALLAAVKLGEGLAKNVIQTFQEEMIHD